MAWRRPGAKPLSEPMMVILVTNMYVTRPQWFKQTAKQTIFTDFHNILWVSDFFSISNWKLIDIEGYWYKCVWNNCLDFFNMIPNVKCLSKLKSFHVRYFQYIVSGYDRKANKCVHLQDVTELVAQLVIAVTRSNTVGEHDTVCSTGWKYNTRCVVEGLCVFNFGHIVLENPRRKWYVMCGRPREPRRFWGLRFEAGIQIMKQFAHNWHLPCCQAFIDSLWFLLCARISKYYIIFDKY